MYIHTCIDHMYCNILSFYVTDTAARADRAAIVDAFMRASAK